ncbi:translational activator of GCN4, partial [Cryomyces antarcticus]
TDGVGHEALNAAITALTIKDSTPHARNTVLLGVIAGVCARSLQLKPILEERKKDYYAFYVREILGSRTVVPQHITDGLRDFLATFTTKEDLQKEIVPSVEKALLRAPEIVLNGLVAGTLQSLSQGIDLSEVLQKSLLKPLLANVKSTNVTIRNGALSTFETLASRSKNEDLTQMVADELLNPLKQSKTTSVDQRVIYAQMLSALNTSRALAKKIPLGLASLAIKEANEIAIAAETHAIAIHVTFALKHQITLDKTVTDAFVKGLVEKGLPARRLWALRVGNILWSLSAEEMELADVASFADPIVEKLIDIWHEVVQNPIPAIQNGQIAASYVATALAVSKLTNVKELKAASIVRKASVAKHALAIDPKPSFLLNSRVYTK